MPQLRPIQEPSLVLKPDFTDQCYCHVTDDGNLKARCVLKGHCIFLASGIRPNGCHPKEIRVGALTDYFAGMTCDGISVKWHVSKSYVGNMLARAGIPGRSKEVKAANIKAGQMQVTRKLIPYAGKE